MRIPVSFFPFVDRPLIKVEIENKKYSLLVDLGSSHPIDLHKKSMEEIKNKKFLEVSKYVGMRGKTYPTQAFQLPQVRLLNLVIEGLVGFEENLDFLKDAKTWQSSSIWGQFKDQLDRLTVDGRMGWTIFNDGTVFFDFPHSALVIAKDLNTLIGKGGYPLDEFERVPFELQKWGLVLSVKTDMGNQKFLLDTGVTCSLIRASLFSEKLKAPYVSEQLKIGNVDLGSWKFRLTEYNDEMECDGILGIDFFKRHEIYLDFHNQIAYIKRDQDFFVKFISDFRNEKCKRLSLK